MHSNQHLLAKFGSCEDHTDLQLLADIKEPLLHATFRTIAFNKRHIGKIYRPFIFFNQNCLFNRSEFCEYLLQVNFFHFYWNFVHKDFFWFSYVVQGGRNEVLMVKGNFAIKSFSFEDVFLPDEFVGDFKCIESDENETARAIF